VNDAQQSLTKGATLEREIQRKVLSNSCMRFGTGRNKETTTRESLRMRMLESRYRIGRGGEEQTKERTGMTTLRLFTG